MDQSIKQILNTAGTLLSNPLNRCTGYSAEDVEGNQVEYWDDKACKFCLTGAIGKVLLDNVGTQYDPHFDAKVYGALREVLGLEGKTPAPLIWDSAEEFDRQAIADRLRDV
jgi:hypothetical protein